MRARMVRRQFARLLTGAFRIAALRVDARPGRAHVLQKDRSRDAR